MNHATSNASAYSTGEWYSLTGTYDGEYMRLYVNDELAAETEKAGAISYASDATLTLGAYYDVNEEYGLIGALAAVSIGEATAVASSPPTATPVPTVSSAPTLTPVPTALVDEAWFRWQDPPEDVVTAGWVDSVGEWTAVSGGPSDPTYSASGDGSVVFDGSARLLVASANVSHLPSATISVAATVRVDARAETWGAAVSFMQINGDYERGWMLGWDDSNFVFSVSTDEDGVMNHATSNASAYSTGEWYSLTGTYDGEYMRLYVNDELAAETEKAGAISYASDATLTLGAYYDVNEEYGLIGALAAVSIGEATAVASPPPTATPVPTVSSAPTLTPVPTASSVPTLTPSPTALVDDHWFRWEDPPEDVATAGWVDLVDDWVAIAEGSSDPTYSASGYGSVVFDGSARLSVASANASHLPSATISVAATVRVDARAEGWGAAVGFIQDDGDYESGWILGWNGSNFIFSVATADDGGRRRKLSTTSRSRRCAGVVSVVSWPEDRHRTCLSTKVHLSRPAGANYGEATAP